MSFAFPYLHSRARVDEIIHTAEAFKIAMQAQRVSRGLAIKRKEEIEIRTVQG